MAGTAATEGAKSPHMRDVIYSMVECLQLGRGITALANMLHSGEESDRIRVLLRKECDILFFGHLTAPSAVMNICDEINGLLVWLSQVYLPLKETACTQYLFHLLQEREVKISKCALNAVEDETFCKAALSMFLIAATMHLLLLQEMAYHYPNAADPTKYSLEIIDKTRVYSDFAMAISRRLWVARFGCVCIFGTSKIAPVPVNNIGAAELTAGWVDNLTGEQYTSLIRINKNDANPCKDQKPFLEDMDLQLKLHVIKIRHEMEVSLGCPRRTAMKWSQHIYGPLATIAHPMDTKCRKVEQENLAPKLDNAEPNNNVSVDK